MQVAYAHAMLREAEPGIAGRHVDRQTDLCSSWRWQAVFGRSVPEHLTADLLRRMIANRIQEEVAVANRNAFGARGLTVKARAET